MALDANQLNNPNKQPAPGSSFLGNFPNPNGPPASTKTLSIANSSQPPLNSEVLPSHTTFSQTQALNPSKYFDHQNDHHQNHVAEVPPSLSSSPPLPPPPPPPQPPAEPSVPFVPDDPGDSSPFSAKRLVLQRLIPFAVIILIILGAGYYIDPLEIFRRGPESLNTADLKSPYLEGEILEIGKDTNIKGKLTINGEFVAPNVVFAITAGDNISITGGQNPVISAAFTEIDTLASITARENSTTQRLSLLGGADFGSLLGLASLSSDPSGASNGSIYYNNISNRFRCHINGSWNDCDTDTDTVGSDGDITTISVGNGFSGGGTSGDISLDILLPSSGTSSNTSSNSGIELSEDGISLLRGCVSSQILKWNGSNWACSNDLSGGTGNSTIQEGGVTVTTGIDTYNYNGSDFDVSAVGATATIAIDYTNSNITRRDQTESVSGAWTFSNLTVSDTNISLSGASTTLTSTGAFMLTAGGAVTLGDGGNTLSINSSDWDISTTGAITNATYEGLTISPTTGTLTIANGKTLTASNSLTFTGTDGTSFAFPSSSGTVCTTTTCLTGSSAVTSLEGTENQVLVNGSFGTPTTGAVVLTLPQDIAITSTPTFAGLTAIGSSTVGISYTNSSGHALIQVDGEDTSQAGYYIHKGGVEKVQIAVVESSNDLTFNMAGTPRMVLTEGGDLQILGLGTDSAVYTDSSSNLTTTAPTSGTIGYWSRSSTTLSPATAGDHVDIGSAGNFLAGQTTGKIGFGGAVSGSDYLINIALDNTQDWIRGINIIQNIDSLGIGEESEVINIENTATVTATTALLTNIKTSLTPGAANVEGNAVYALAGEQIAVSDANLTLKTSTNTLFTAGSQLTVTASPIFDSASGNDDYSAYGIYSSLAGSPTLTAVTAGTTYRTAAGYFSNTNSSAGNANLIAVNYGIQASSTGNLTTTGTTTHYAGHFTASGTADTNYGIYTTASGATTNYALYSAAGTNTFLDKSGFGADASASDYLINIEGTSAADYSRLLNITQANDTNEDSTVLNIANTVNIGSSSTTPRVINNLDLSLTPTMTLTSASVTVKSTSISGIKQNLSFANTTFGTTSGTGRIVGTLYGEQTTLDVSPTLNDATGTAYHQVLAHGNYISLTGSPTLTAVPNMSTSMITAAGTFINSISSAGNANLTISNIGISVAASGDLTTTGDTSHVGGRFTVSGSADSNTALQLSASGASSSNYGINITSVSQANALNYGIMINEIDSGDNNYGIFINTIASATNNYAIYSNAAAQSYIAGNVGIGATEPRQLMELYIANPTTHYQYLSAGTVSQPATSFVPADVFGTIGTMSSTAGGMIFSGYSDTDAGGIQIDGTIGASDPTDTTAAITIRGMKSDGGTSRVGVGTNETVLSILSQSTPLMTILGGGNVGIGSVMPSAKLHIDADLAADDGVFYQTLLNGEITGNQIFCGGNCIDIYSLYVNPSYTSSAGNTINTLTAAYLTPSNSSSGTITTMYGIDIRPVNSTGTIGTLYGTYIGAPTNNGTITNKYALVTESGAGNVGIGTVSPQQKLHISSGASAAMRLTSNDGTNKIEMGTAEGSYLWGMYTSGTDLKFKVSGAIGDQLTLNNNGNATLAGGLTQGSDRNIKENFSEINQQEILQKLTTLPNSKWNYTTDENNTPHIGPMAQDFYQAFGLGGTDKGINIVDMQGVLLAGIQALFGNFEDLKSQVEAANISNGQFEIDEDGSVVTTIRAERLVLEENADISGTVTAGNYSLDASSFNRTGVLASLSVSDGKVSVVDAINRLAETQTSQALALEEAKVLGQQAVDQVLSLDEKVASTSSSLSSLQSKIDELLAGFGDTPECHPELDSGSSECIDSGSEAGMTGQELTDPSTLMGIDSVEINNILVQSEATVSGALQAYNGIFQNSLKSLGETLLGNTTLAGDFNIDGTMHITGSSINSLACHPGLVEGSADSPSSENDTNCGILFLQNSSLAERVDVFNGLITLEKDGSVIAKSVAAEEIKVLGGKTAGAAFIPSGANFVIIENPLIKENSVISITPEILIDLPLAVTEKISETSFKVEIAGQALADIPFTYLIINQE